jgi:GrpB-like predicted nucleotidyltransferase (UPF0157 family)
MLSTTTTSGPLCSNQSRDASLQPLEDLGALVEHVGSTAVPGLAAKQVVDIDVVVRDLRDIKAASQRLEELGYVARAPPRFEQTPIMRVPALRTPIRGVPRARSC